MKKFLLILLTLFSANASAVFYKWVDTNGRVHYSDQPPPASMRVKKMLPPPEIAPPGVVSPIPASGVPAVSAPTAPTTMAEREAELKKAEQAKQEAADKAAQEQAAAEARKANCDIAQRNLRTLQLGTRIMEVEASGQRTYLDDAQRQERMAKAQQEIDTYCK